LKNAGLGFVAAAAGAVLLFIVGEAQVGKFTAGNFSLLVLGAGAVGFFASFLWFHLLICLGNRSFDFVGFDFSDPDQRRRRWEK
jgi:hypothetical protein